MSKNRRKEPVVAVEPSVAVEPVVAPEPKATSARLGLGLCGLPPMRRMDFQDALLEANREMRLTDPQLAQLMNLEHPWGCDIPLAYVRGIRRLYNAGKHTKHQAKPAIPVPEFNANGEPVGKPAAEPVAVAAAE